VFSFEQIKKGKLLSRGVDVLKWLEAKRQNVNIGCLI
jgi:hypothetical protein